MTAQESATPAGTVVAETPNGQPPGVLNILMGILIRPRAAFKSLREMKQGYWWLAFLVTIATLLFYTVLSTSVTSSVRQGFTPPAGAIAGNVNANAAPGATTSTNAPTFQITQPSPLSTIGIPLVAGIATMLLGYAFRSLVAFGASLVLGGHSTFKQTFRMAVWTTLPIAFRHVIQAVAVVSTQGRIISGLSGVMTTLETRSLPFLNTLLAQVDLYNLWSLVLLGIGISVTTKLGKGKSTIAVLIYIVVCVVGFLIYTLAGNAIGGLGGGFQGPGIIRGPRG